MRCIVYCMSLHVIKQAESACAPVYWILFLVYRNQSAATMYMVQKGSFVIYIYIHTIISVKRESCKRKIKRERMRVSARRVVIVIVVVIVVQHHRYIGHR
jgi:hypothetical protein